MHEPQDKLLNQQRSVSSGGYEWSFVAIPERVITIVSGYIQLVWTIKNFRKSTSAKDVLQNAKSMFENNQRGSVDSLWKEHCAGSLREFVDCHMPADFLYALKSLPNPTSNDGERLEIYVHLQTYKRTLNELAHLNNSTALQEIRKIPKYKDLGDIDDQSFDEICTDYVMLLYQLFRENCMKGD